MTQPRGAPPPQFYLPQPLPQPSGPPPRQQHYDAEPPPPQPNVVEAAPRRRGPLLLGIAALLVALAAAVMSGISLVRHPDAPPSAALAPASPNVSAPNAADVAAAKTTACDSWATASSAMISARKPFLNAPPDWQNPITVSALVQAQAGILAQVEYLRQHVTPTTPADVAGPIADFIAANIDLIAIDGQFKPAAPANAAADRSNAAASKIRTACGIS